MVKMIVYLILLALGLLTIILVLVLLKIAFKALAIALGGLTNIIVIPFNRKYDTFFGWHINADNNISVEAGLLWVLAWICTFFLLPSGAHTELCMFWGIVTPAFFFAGMLSSEEALGRLGCWPYSKLGEYSWLRLGPPPQHEERVNEIKPPSETYQRYKDDTRYWMAQDDAHSRALLRWLTRRK